MQKIDCVIPFYNEDTRVVSVVSKILKSTRIGRVICVDDGSDDNVGKHIWPRDTRIIHIRHPQNLGKTQAVRTGLIQVRSAYVCLIDADIISMNPAILDRHIDLILANSADLGIWIRDHAYLIPKVLRLHLLLGGERLVRTSLLRDLLAAYDIERFQLETAMNAYCMRNRKRTVAIPARFWHMPKIRKFGVLHGVWGDLTAYRQIIAYRGISEAITQIIAFRPTILPS